MRAQSSPLLSSEKVREESIFVRLGEYAVALGLQLFLVWYFIIGFLLGNGVPHFAFGAAGKIFRSPFGQKSSPRTNVLWGLSNFAVATIIVGALVALSLYSSYALIALLVGFWLTMLMFGTGIKRFLNE